MALFDEARDRYIEGLERRIERQETGKELPVFPSVRVYMNRDLAIPHNAETAVLFNAENWDTVDNNWVSGSPTRLTAHRSGVYAIFGGVDFANNSTGVRALTIRVNGTTIIAAVRKNVSNATWSERLCLSCRWRLVKNDYVELFAYQNSGGNLDVRRLVDYSPAFEMTMVAPYY